jgi:predicted ATPase
MRLALARHDDVVRSSVESHGGWVFATVGDGFGAAFDRAGDGLGAALEAQDSLGSEGWPEGCVLRVRMGLHSGEAEERDGDYFGSAVNRAARLMAVAHGGQIVLSQATADLAVEALPEGAGLRDLGVHRLKDLSRPERIFQLDQPDLPVEFPPLRSLDVRVHNLPVQRTSFIGRQEELKAVKRLLGEERLVSLVGSGGCGKTRLALQSAAEALDDYPEGVWLADLAAVAEPGAVATEVAQIFALKEGPGMSAADAVVAYMAAKRALLILDNCEHVLGEAAELVDRLASSCPALGILTTSRQPLNLPGEVAWRVPSLSVPEDRLGEIGSAVIAELTACEAVQLFVDRATRTRPGFALSEANSAAVVDICCGLDGIPLAIELAAARVPVLTPAQIAAGLDQRFALLTVAPRTARPRQQTLEASVEWSHELLTQEEQALFRRLSVFAGDFDYVAVVAVCTAPPVASHQVLDQLGQLVDKSLLLMDDSGEQARYRLLETLRAYAGGRLAQTDEESSTRAAHRDYYLALAEAAEPHLEGPGQTEWMALVAADHPNLRAALSWSTTNSDNEELARIGAAIHLYWAFHGPNSDGAAWLDRALEPGRALPPQLRAKTLLAKAHLASFNFDVGTVGPLAQEGVELARQLGDDRLTARFLCLLGQVEMLMGQPDLTVDEAVGLARRVGDSWGLSLSLFVQGAGRMMSDLTGSRQCYEEARRVAETAGNRFLANQASGMLAWPMLCTGDLLEARVLCDEVAITAQAMGDRMTSAIAIMYAALALVEADERAQALGYADRLERVTAELDMQLWKVYVPNVRGQVALANRDYQDSLRLTSEAADLGHIPLTRSNTLPALVEAEIAERMYTAASSHIDELASLSETGSRYYMAWALVLRARLLRLQGQAIASEVVQEALDVAVGIEAKTRIVDGLEVLAGIAVDAGRAEDAARLFGAAEHLRDKTGYRRCVSERDADLDHLLPTLGDVAFEEVYDQGRSLALEEAIAYVRRGRWE